jgi:tryptophan 2,3-dioxygenase
VTSDLGPATAPDLEYRGRTPYVAYTDSDVLAGLIHPRTDEPLEVTFIVTTQVMELHFQLLIREFERAIERLNADDQPEALAALHRAAVTQDSLIGSWRLLSVMSPVQYNRFRTALGSASGFQSFSYRNLEFLLGAKNPSLLRPHADMTAVHARLQTALAAPSLYDAALAYLSRHGFAVPADVLERDWSEPWENADPRVVQVWQQVYAAGGTESALAEALVAVAERHTTWRFVHYTAVRRILGAKPGTGGSAGLSWLKQSADATVFADLWAVRGVL